MNNHIIISLVAEYYPADAYTLFLCNRILYKEYYYPFVVKELKKQMARWSLSLFLAFVEDIVTWDHYYHIFHYTLRQPFFGAWFSSAKWSLQDRLRREITECLIFFEYQEELIQAIQLYIVPTIRPLQQASFMHKILKYK